MIQLNQLDHIIYSFKGSIYYEPVPRYPCNYIYKPKKRYGVKKRKKWRKRK